MPSKLLARAARVVTFALILGMSGLLSGLLSGSTPAVSSAHAQDARPSLREPTVHAPVRGKEPVRDDRAPSEVSLEPSALSLPVVARGRGVLVRAEPGMDRLARDVAARVPDVLARIHEDLWDLPVPARVEVRLVKRSRDITAASPAGRRAPPWAAGVAFPDLAMVVVATRREAQSIDVAGVIDHELAHLALGAALGERAPRWLHEGFAYLHSSSDWSFERARTLTGMAWFGNIMNLAELEHGFPARENAADRAYAQSYDFVTYLAYRGPHADTHDDGDRWAFRRFLAEISAGRSVEQAAHAAFGAGLDELFDEWQRDLKGRYMLLPVGMFALGMWVIAALLLIVAYIRRRRLAKKTLERWEREEQEAADLAADAAEPGRVCKA